MRQATAAGPMRSLNCALPGPRRQQTKFQRTPPRGIANSPLPILRSSEREAVLSEMGWKPKKRLRDGAAAPASKRPNRVVQLSACSRHG